MRCGQTAIQFLLQETIGLANGAHLYHELVFGIYQPHIGGDGIRLFQVITQQRLYVRRFNVLSAQVAAAGDLDRVGKTGEGGADVLFTLRNRLRQRGGYAVLQQFLIASQRFAVPLHHLGGVEIKRHHTHRDQHDENQVQNRYAGRQRQFHKARKLILKLYSEITANLTKKAVWLRLLKYSTPLREYPYSQGTGAGARRRRGGGMKPLTGCEAWILRPAQ